MKLQLGRPVGADGEQTRQRILTAAMRCVAEAGYSGATIREIARAAEMTSGTLYHYFPNKAELMKATVRDIEELVFPRLRAAAAQGADVATRLDAVLDEADRLMREHPYLAAFERAIRVEGASFLRSGGGAEPDFRLLRDILHDIVTDAQAQGALAPGTDAAAATDAVYALTRGLTEQAAVLPPKTYHATVQAAKQLIRGTLFEPR